MSSIPSGGDLDFREYLPEGEHLIEDGYPLEEPVYSQAAVSQHAQTDYVTEDYPHEECQFLESRTSFRHEEYEQEEYEPTQKFKGHARRSKDNRPFRSVPRLYQSRRSEKRPPIPRNPLKIACMGPTFGVGGVRQHALALARFLDPARARITDFIVTEPPPAQRPAGFQLPAPLHVCDSATLERVSRECDVLLMWGTGFNDRITSHRPLRVFLAHGETWWTRNAINGSSKVVDHIIAVSDRVRRSICKGFPTTTILNGVDTARLGQTASRRDLRRRFAFSEGDFVVGSVGRLTREKQFALLIESVALLPEHFKLLLVGSGRRYQELLDLANRCIPGRFAIVAASDYLGDFYSVMDAFALVSAHEGFGLVLAEAMMCGRPVIATSVGCAPEVIRNRINGMLVEPDPDAIAQAIRLLHEHPRWARGLASEGRAYADAHLHAARMAREYEDLLLRLHYNRSGRRRAAR